MIEPLYKRIKSPFCLCAFCLTLLLTGCTSAPVSVQQDGISHLHPPPADLAGIPDATPKVEPHSRYGNPRVYTVMGRDYQTLRSSQGYRERGIASWYGSKFHGRRTSSGEPYDMYAMTAAHKSLPLPTYARVRNLENGRSVIVRVNDRGPFHNNRIIDLSYTAAWKLGISGEGTGLVEVEAIDPSLSEPTASPGVIMAETGLPRLFLQVGAFSSEENAHRLKNRLENALNQRLPQELETVILAHADTSGSTPVYRVQLGPIASVQLCDHLTDRLTDLGIANTHLVIR